METGQSVSPEASTQASRTSSSLTVSGVIRVLLRLIQWVFLFVSWAFWAVFGTAFWFAVIFRALSVFSATFLYAMFTYQTPRSIAPQLEDITDLWFRGFRNAYRSVFGLVVAQPLETRHARLVLEVLWSSLFWTGNIIILRGRVPGITDSIAIAIFVAAALLLGFLVGAWRGSTVLRRFGLSEEGHKPKPADESGA